jgi:hypothetical protein
MKYGQIRCPMHISEGFEACLKILMSFIEETKFKAPWRQSFDTFWLGIRIKYKSNEEKHCSHCLNCVSRNQYSFKIYIPINNSRPKAQIDYNRKLENLPTTPPLDKCVVPTHPPHSHFGPSHKCHTDWFGIWWASISFGELRRSSEGGLISLEYPNINSDLARLGRRDIELFWPHRKLACLPLE